MLLNTKGFHSGSAVKDLPGNAGHVGSTRVRKIPCRRKQQPTPVFLPRKFHRQRSLVGCSPWGCKKWGTTELTQTHTGEKWTEVVSR